MLGEERFERLTSLDLGDLHRGRRRGACAAATARSRCASRASRSSAKALRPPPDKHHGLSDVETRYRQRELDLIASEEARRLFIDRARIISAIRA